MRRPRPYASIVLFFAIVLGIAIWIGSGILQREQPTAPAREDRSPVTVAVTTSEAEPVERLLTLYGDIEPNQLVLVRAETAGRIAEVRTSRGARVETGDELVQLAMGDRQARLREAQANLAEAQREFERAEQLVARGTAPEARLQTAEAELEAARAELENIRVEIEHTTLRAPIAGVVNRLVAEVGDFLSVGSEAVEIVDNDPLLAIVQVPQHAIGRVQAGDEARVSMIGREAVEGTVTSIAALADAQTRTFRVEIEVPNPAGEFPSGVSAEVVIPTETVAAHRISPALVALNDQGQIGVFAVDESDTIVFHDIRLVRAEADGIWVTGPPHQARLITTRPGFVTPGQEVEAREVSGDPGIAAPAGS